jgi:CubicO group peptidase (beta-lactamase class C family)
MRSLAITFSFFLAASIPAQTSAEVDRTVREYMERTKAPGVSVALIRDGKTVLQKGYGLANLEADSPATAETVYRIGSLTKMFTAALVMRLVEEGKVGLDDPIVKHLPDLPKGYEKVTVRHLLSHTSGIPNYTDLPEFWPRARERGTAKAMIEMAAKAKPDFVPGKGWNYSNTGYIVLGELVVKLRGKPYAQVLSDEITKPLKLTRTRYSNLGVVVPQRAAGYTAGPRNADYLDMGWPGSAGALESTVGDLVTFLTNLAPGYLKPPTVATMQRVEAPAKDYGLGFAVGKLKGHKMVFHGGGIPGFAAFCAEVPDLKVGVVVLTNFDDAKAETLARGLLGQMEQALKEDRVPVKDDQPELTAFSKSQLQRLFAGELKSEELTPEFAKILTPDLIQSTKQAFGNQGPITKFELLSADGATRSYLFEIGGEVLTATFKLTPDRKIAGLVIKA